MLEHFRDRQVEDSEQRADGARAGTVRLKNFSAPESITVAPVIAILSAVAIPSSLAIVNSKDGWP
jgi:hypothetical protein